MKLILPDALHARPANLLVRVATRSCASVTIRYGSKVAKADSILEILALAAPKGASIEVTAGGNCSQAAFDDVVQLIQRNFDQDLVPEWAAAAVEGIALGRGVTLSATEVGGGTEDARGASPAELEQLVERVARDAESDLRALVVALGPSEGALLEPEIEIVRALVPMIRERIRTGELPEAAVVALTEAGTSDLLLDARVRFIEGLRRSARGESGAGESANGAPHVARELIGVAEDAIVICEELTPTLVARLPKNVVGILGVSDDELSSKGLFTSHAALLARGRGLPLAFAPGHVAAGLEGEVLIVDTTLTPARIWVAPGEVLVEETKRRQIERNQRAAEAARNTAAPLVHLGIAVRVNVGSLDDVVPEGAEGVGLVRTELVFAAQSDRPDEERQASALTSIVARARGGPVVARLFDAGGDKPLPWLPPPPKDLEARGIALLFHHEDVLRSQLRALAKAARNGDVRALVPLVRGAEDMRRVRDLAPSGLRIGAMIETPEAAMDVEAIARESDFISIGTNDLTASVLGASRETGTLEPDERVFALVRRVIELGHAAGKSVTICGEFAGTDRGACIFVGMGVDAISVAPPRLSPLKAALGSTSRDACRTMADAALKRSDP